MIPSPGHEITRREMLRRAALLGLVVAGGSSLAGCGTEGAATKKGPSNSVGGDLSSAQINSMGWGVTGSLTSLDFAKNFTVSTAVVSALAYDPLVTFAHDFSIVPWLAKPNESSLTDIVYDIRPGVTFWDGTPLTAEDVAYSFSRHVDPKVQSQQSFLLPYLKAATVTGPNQVTLQLSQPDPTMHYVAANIQIFSHKQAKAAGANFGGPNAIPMGTGMYSLSKYTPDGGVSAARNDKFWGQKPRVRQFDIKVLTDADTLRLAAQQGDVAGAFEIEPSQIRRWKSTKGLTAAQSPGLNMLFLSFPTTTAPFDDVHVRRALAYCLDRKGLAEASLSGAGEPAVSIATRGHWQGVMSAKDTDAYLKTLPSYAFDLKKAKAELGKSKHGGGFTTECVVASNSQKLQKVVLSLQQNAAKIGVKINIKQLTSEQVGNDYGLGHKPVMFANAFAPDYPDPIDFLSLLLLSSQRAPGNGYNSAGFSDPAVDKMIDEQAGKTGAERLEILQKIGKIAQEQVPYAPVLWQSATLGFSKKYRFNDFDGFASARPFALSIGLPK